MLHITELGLLCFMTFLKVKYCVRKALFELNHLYLVSFQCITIINNNFKPKIRKPGCTCGRLIAAVKGGLCSNRIVLFLSEFIRNLLVLNGVTPCQKGTVHYVKLKEKWLPCKQFSRYQYFFLHTSKLRGKV